MTFRLPVLALLAATLPGCGAAGDDTAADAPTPVESACYSPNGADSPSYAWAASVPTGASDVDITLEDSNGVIVDTYDYSYSNDTHMLTIVSATLVYNCNVSYLP